MTRHVLIAQSLFDGERLRADGPFTVVIESGRIADVLSGDRAAEVDGAAVRRVGFLLPGLVDAHVHLFLDGGERDTAARAANLKTSRETMVEAGRANVRRNLAHGVTLVRDAGDKHGINHQLRAENAGGGLRIRSAGLGLRRPKGYGAFMAREVEDPARLPEIVAELARDSDDIKIILTGIIDFEKGTVIGTPQFDLAACTAMTTAARAAGRKTFAHCSGLDGLAIAVEAHIDSIEHGFFIDRAILARMAERRIAWVPTFSPVEFQAREPAWCQWPATTVEVLRGILDAHARHLVLAAQLGVPLVCGSDAGSHGVAHGLGLIEEIGLMVGAGLDTGAALRAATSTPRRLWGEPSADIVKGNRAELVALAASPFADLAALRQVEAVMIEGQWIGT